MARWTWLKILAWMVISVSVVFVGLWGLAIASPSVVVNRQGFLEFGITGGLLCVSLLLICRGPFKLLVVVAGIVVILSLGTGLSVESSRFDLGHGGPWIAGVPLQLTGFLAVLMSVSTYLAMSHHISKGEQNAGDRRPSL